MQQALCHKMHGDMERHRMMHGHCACHVQNARSDNAPPLGSNQPRNLGMGPRQHKPGIARYPSSWNFRTRSGVSSPVLDTSSLAAVP